MSHAMSDDQVSAELKKMTAFIRQEALEKAQEIRIKADEEFAIEKSKLVRAETSSIDNAYEKKFKQASMSQQITRSTLANKTRLKLLSARQELLDELFGRAQAKLKAYTEDKGKYREICKNLILEGAYALNEEKVSVRARKADYETVQGSIDDAKKEYKENLDREVEIELDEKNPQPEDSVGKDRSAESTVYYRAGGISIVGSGGKIDINNTFDERLKLLESDALPMVRTSLFGKNENRRFYD
ncbi:MAG: vacuolar atp synthase subunit e [Lasallia pustulata]|uniref:Vacuolar atp synthase subunit e n=1 Tax=Lasallia pustulata TaxID=136370 RepID=A0A5M8PYT0_9LECA|nr:MAG: vacuolar atp synthase subunit e [Lasallia pustulata]